MNRSNKLWELSDEELLDRVFVVGTSLRLWKALDVVVRTSGVGTSGCRTTNGLEVKFLFGEHFGG
ncbi:hypothetical protein A2U01_0047727, partial [Trifolium medium]|nr:hypothetical protein [Trifolium medium]